MANPNALPPSYPEFSKPNNEGTWPAGGQVQYVQQPYGYPGNQVHVVHHAYIDPAIGQIRDWLPWSIVNIFVGWIFAGILPLIFSLVCRNYKSTNNASGAKTMSTLALVFNILVTISGIVGWILLIVLIVAANRIANSCLTYPYYC
jgi:hypothetical protein